MDYNQRSHQEPVQIKTAYPDTNHKQDAQATAPQQEFGQPAYTVTPRTYDTSSTPVIPLPTTSATIISFILSLLGAFYLPSIVAFSIYGGPVILLTLPIFSSIAAVVFAHLALRVIKRSMGKLGGKLQTFIGLGIGYGTLALTLVFGIVWAVLHLIQARST